MKIVFVIPGTKVKVLEDTDSVVLNLSRTPNTEGYKLKKGDELKVSQVYIRKNGWFQSSLTFKAVAGPIMDYISDYVLTTNKANHESRIKELEMQLQLLDSFGTDTEWYLKLNFQAWAQYGQIPKSTITEKHGTNKTTVKALRALYETEKSGTYYSGMYHGRYSESKFYIRTDINKELAALKKKLSKPPKQGKMAVTFRVSLKEIESWEVEIER